MVSIASNYWTCQLPALRIHHLFWIPEMWTRFLWTRQPVCRFAKLYYKISRKNLSHVIYGESGWDLFPTSIYSIKQLDVSYVIYLHILLMEDIPNNHLGCKKNLVYNSGRFQLPTSTGEFPGFLKQQSTGQRFDGQNSSPASPGPCDWQELGSCDDQFFFVAKFKPTFRVLYCS